jgi:TPR repeat protein
MYKFKANLVILIINLCLLIFSTNALSTEAMSAFNNKNYDEAYRLWFANPDTPEANYGMGRIVLEGLGSAPKNSSRGMSLIEKAAGAGFRPAASFLADHYERTGNIQGAIKYLERLSEKKDLQLEQRILSIIAKGQKGDPTSSKQYCDTLVNVGKLGGQTKQLEFAFCAVNGHPSILSKDEALSSLNSAGNEAYLKMEYLEAHKIWSSIPETSSSLFGLGMLNLNGLGGVKKNIEKGVNYLEKAVNAGNREAATELGKHYQNLGDTEKSLSFYKKGCDEKDTKCNRLQAEIYAKANPTLNKEQCERIRLAKYPETASEYTDYLTCAFTDLISDMPKEQAGKKLKEQLVKKPTLNGLMKLGPELLKPTSSLYDLVEFENMIWRIDPELKNIEIRNLAKSSGITDETIADMPVSSEERKRAKVSASLIAALGGNKKKAFYVGKYFSSIATNDLSQLPKANAVLRNILDTEKDTLDYKKIELNIIKAESFNNASKDHPIHKKHLVLLTELVKLDNKDQNFLTDHFSHQFTLANNFISNDTPSFTVDMILQLTQSITIVNIKTLQSSGLDIIQQIEKKLRKYLDHNDETEYQINSNKLNTVTKLANDLINSGIQPVKNTSENRKIDSPNKTKEIITNPEKTISDPNKRSDSKTNNALVSASPKASEYSKFKYECDQNIGLSCTRAAEILLGSDIPDDYRNRSSKDRRESAIKLLEKANDLKDLSGVIVLYDTLDSETNIDAREKANALLKQRNFAETVSGQLRKFARDLKFDPLRTPANLILRKKETKAHCDQVEKLKGSNLSTKDEKIANEIISGFTCRGLQNLISPAE